MRYSIIPKVNWSFHAASGRSGCFDFLFWSRTAILRSRMKLLFFILWKFVKFFMSFLKEQVIFPSDFAAHWNGTSIPLQILHHSSLSWPVNFKLIHFLLWIKGSFQSPNFETFDCSGENLPNSSCHFPNYKSVFLQIFHDTLLYFFSSNIIYFARKRAIKVQILKIRSNFAKFLSFLKKQIGFSANFASLFSVMKHNSSVLFSWNFI